MYFIHASVVPTVDYPRLHGGIVIRVPCADFTPFPQSSFLYLTLIVVGWERKKAETRLVHILSLKKSGTGRLALKPWPGASVDLLPCR